MPKLRTLLNILILIKESSRLIWEPGRFDSEGPRVYARSWCTESDVALTQILNPPLPRWVTLGRWLAFRILISKMGIILIYSTKGFVKIYRMHKSHSAPHLRHGHCRSICTRVVMKVKIMFSPFSRSCRQNLIVKANFLTSSFLWSSHLPQTPGPAALPGPGLACWSL